MKTCKQTVCQTTEYSCSNKEVFSGNSDPRIIAAESIDPNRFLFIFLAILLWFISASCFALFAAGAVSGDLAHVQYRSALIAIVFMAIVCSIFAMLLYSKTRDTCALVDKEGKVFLVLRRSFLRGSIEIEQESVNAFITGVSYEILPRIGRARKSKKHLLKHEYGLWVCVVGRKSKKRIILHSSYETHDRATEGAVAVQGTLEVLLANSVEICEVGKTIKIAYRVY